MRTVDITTSQKVTIRYEIASFRDRLVAWITDFVIQIAAVLIVITIIALWLESQSVWPYRVTLLIPFFYHLFFELLFNGQSPGKRALGLRIIKLDGSQPAMADYIIRWAFRMVDIMLSLGTIAAALISSGSKGQRLGDMLSNTVVVKLNPTHSVYLQDLLKIQAAGDYKPQYPEARLFTEPEMLLIKDALDRQRRFPNEAHNEAISTLADKVASRLGPGLIEEDASTFLRTVLKDYVVMTR